MGRRLHPNAAVSSVNGEAVRQRQGVFASQVPVLDNFIIHIGRF